MIKSKCDHSVFYRQSEAGSILLVVYVDDIIITDPDNGEKMTAGTPGPGYDYWYKARPSTTSYTVRIKASVLPENTTYPNVDFEVEEKSYYTFESQEGCYGVINFHDLEYGDPVTCRIVVKSTDGKKLQKVIGIACMYA